MLYTKDLDTRMVTTRSMTKNKKGKEALYVLEQPLILDKILDHLDVRDKCKLRFVLKDNPVVNHSLNMDYKAHLKVQEEHYKKFFEYYMVSSGFHNGTYNHSYSVMIENLLSSLGVICLSYTDCLRKYPFLIKCLINRIDAFLGMCLYIVDYYVYVDRLQAYKTFLCKM